MPCVRSTYLGQGINGTVERSLNIYNKSERYEMLLEEKAEQRDSSTIGEGNNQIKNSEFYNISLKADKKGPDTMLTVTSKAAGEIFEWLSLPALSPQTVVSNDQLQFLVLYGSDECLLLAYRGNSTSSNHTRNTSLPFCMLWIPEAYVSKPPNCCVFLFLILCGQDMLAEQRNLGVIGSSLTKEAQGFWGAITSYRSANISLNASEKLTLGVNVTSAAANVSIFSLSATSRTQLQNVNEYNFLVLYGSNQCLLLAEIPKSENSRCPGLDCNSLRCSLWFPNTTSNNPLPQCCKFLFNILCEKGG
ncbi:hypothetical protein MRX96_043786 [Rhipicephalus microplus]